jgi:hypothetical protein
VIDYSQPIVVAREPVAVPEPGTDPAAEASRLFDSAREAFRAGEPALIEVPVGQFPDPWRLFFRQKCRG